MRAVVNGYKAEPGNRFWLPVPRTSDDKGDKSFVAYISYSGDWNIGRSYDTNPAHYQATQAEIDAAPDWVKALKPVEVKEDEA
ncbi:hypothetical protein IV56_GL000148 [Lacticaseibacillus saniviri JCM 17471 = DSM 24301]|uniref:Uncharacterized protein n=1 Tax=Lacticaseibacillus saniviri JCM 17471 = DSM 24301 TaxID=1293598 RepID=A0A0R2MSX6_9LACO|nr:hypothetical protein IV56_GL000148 [Lacticaseibacillus saniviri JCM 17471 = DSM 24301]